MCVHVHIHRWCIYIIRCLFPSNLTPHNPYSCSKSQNELSSLAVTQKAWHCLCHKGHKLLHLIVVGHSVAFRYVPHTR